MDNLSEKEFYYKKAQLLRKLTQKATKFLYEKEAKKKGNSVREMAAKKDHEDNIRRARSSMLNASQLSPRTKPKPKVSAIMNLSVRSRKTSTLDTSSTNVRAKINSKLAA